MKIVLLILVTLTCALGQWEPHFVSDRTAIVHLFEWRWVDIAQECEQFLAPYGFGGVQVSPPSENRIINESGIIRPWFERYQPISYKLATRSGTRDEFKDMVKRCNAVGVRIYVDVILNHHTNGGGKSFGTGGSPYDHDKMDYPVIPYSGFDFNGKHNCPNPNGLVEDYQNEIEVRNCKLVGLQDLALHSDYVRARILEYLNRLIYYGVAGFQLDSAKHMWPGDLEIIFKQLDNLSVEHGFQSGSRPFLIQSVFDINGREGVTSPEYVHLGRVTEFKFGAELGKVFRKWDGQKLSYLRNFGEGWGFLAGESAVSFVDSHENQRGGGASGPSIISFKDSRLYKMAQAFTLAWPYAIPRLMSSFNWESDWEGPPHDGNYNTLPVTYNDDLTCNGGWICEHRWRQIYNMVKFRNIASFEPVQYFWDNEGDQIAFSRGNQAFIAINNENFGMNTRIATRMPAGAYCDIISGNKVNGSCTGKIVLIVSGFVEVSISTTDQDQMIAIHAQSKI